MTVSIPDEELDALRRHGFGVAYRMLGSVSESEDVAQEALLRLTRQEGPIDQPAAWITTVTTRLSINVLRSARARRESYVGPGLPEPLLDDPAPGPASRAELADSLSLALLVLLERLNPVERAAYLLREVFGYEYAQIADIIERTEANSRQLVTRARRHLEANRPRFDADEAARDALLRESQTPRATTAGRSTALSAPAILGGPGPPRVWTRRRGPVRPGELLDARSGATTRRTRPTSSCSTARWCRRAGCRISSGSQKVADSSRGAPAVASGLRGAVAHRGRAQAFSPS